jgi:hypothetical protein
MPSPIVNISGERLHSLCVRVDVVREDGSREPLPVYLNEVNHSPDGFEWGYGGSGPAQLAYAILRGSGLSKTEAQALHQSFKTCKIAKLSTPTWSLEVSEILCWVALQKCREQ